MIKLEPISYTPPWSEDRRYDTLHSLCSYLGAFPPSLVRYFIEVFTKEGDVIYDPFSGRGTTLLEARLQGRIGLGSDLNPIAISLSQAKSYVINHQNLQKRVDELRKSYDYSIYLPEAKSQSDEINLIYHPRTLAQLCYLRYELLPSNTEVDRFLIATILGIMHGSERKDGSSGYLSISMPNTFSMAPEYVRKFVQQKQLNRTFHDVFDVLEYRLSHIFKKHISPRVKGYAGKCDVRDIASHQTLRQYKGNVDLVCTSPPYLGVVNYARQNWIRSWFLNAIPEEVSLQLDDDLDINQWIRFMRTTAVNIKKFLKPSGVAVFVIGDVAKSSTSVLPLARDFCRLLTDHKLFQFVHVYSDSIHSGDKTTKIWGETKGQATGIDRIVLCSDMDILSRIEKKDKTGGRDLTNFIKQDTIEYLGL